MTNGKPTDKLCKSSGSLMLEGMTGVIMKRKSQTMIRGGRIGGCMSSIMGGESSWKVVTGEDSKATATMDMDSRGMVVMGLDSRGMVAMVVMDEDSKVMATMGTDSSTTVTMGIDSRGTGSLETGGTTVRATMTPRALFIATIAMAPTVIVVAIAAVVPTIFKTIIVIRV